MAQEGILPTFSTRPRGGSPYAPAYANLADDLGEQAYAATTSRQLRDVLDVARFNREAELDKRREAKQSMIDELRLRSAERKDAEEARRLKRFEDNEALMDNADQVISKIESIDPMHKNAKSQLEAIRQSKDFYRLLANRGTREAIKNSFQNKMAEHSDVVNGIRQEARSKYGIDVDPATLKADDMGHFDIGHIYSTQLPQLGEQMMQKAQQAYESAPDKPGHVKYQEYDEYGRPVAKFVKAPPIGQEEKVEIASGLGLVPSGITASGQVTYGRPKVAKPSGLEMLAQSEGIAKNIGAIPLPSTTTKATTDAAPSPTPMPLGDIFK